MAQHKLSTTKRLQFGLIVICTKHKLTLAPYTQSFLFLECCSWWGI